MYATHTARCNPAGTGEKSDPPVSETFVPIYSIPSSILMSWICSG
jgi:hypothetical protein